MRVNEINGRNIIRQPIAFNAIIICLLALIFISGLIGSYVPFIFRALLFALWTATSISMDKYLFTLRNKVFCSWALLYMWQMLMYIIGHSYTGFSDIFSKFGIYYFPLMMVFVIRNYNLKEFKLLILGIIFVMLYEVVDNIIIGYYNPDIFEDIYLYNTGTTNAARTGVVAVCMFYVGACYLLLRNKTAKSFRFLALVSLVLSGYFIVFVNTRATSLLLLIILITGLFLIPFFSKKKYGILLYFAFILVLFIVVINNLDTILIFLIDIFGANERMIYRLNGLSDNLAYGGMNESSFSGRYGLAMLSIETWTSSFGTFLFGIGDTYSKYSIKLGVGNHSEFFDYLAQYGVIGTTLMISAMVKTMHYIHDSFSELYYRMAVTVFMGVFILYSIFNKSISEEIFFMIFLTVPIFLVYSSKCYFKKNQKYESDKISIR